MKISDQAKQKVFYISYLKFHVQLISPPAAISKRLVSSGLKYA